MYVNNYRIIVIDIDMYFIKYWSILINIDVF